MKTVFSAIVLAVLSLFPSQNAAAQSPEMPIPNLVVKDADGKVISPVVGFHSEASSTSLRAFVVINVDGTLAYLLYETYGLVDLADPTNPGTVYFSETNCTGDAYVNQGGGVQEAAGAWFGVAGPDSTTGEYSMYRSTTLDVTTFSYDSKWDSGSCVNQTSQMGLRPAEEVFPNPLEGFHGPTTANPARILTIDGGTRLP